MSASCGGPQRWWWLSFFAAYLSQHALLMGVTWPLLVVHQVPAPWHPLWDTLAAVAAVTGVGREQRGRGEEVVHRMPAPWHHRGDLWDALMAVAASVVGEGRRGVGG